MLKNLLFTTCLFCITLSCAYSKGLAVVKFKVKPKQHLTLTYKNTENIESDIVFINDGDKDSLIIKTADLPWYTTLYYGMSVIKKTTVNHISNSIYVKNGDTVLLETDADFRLFSKTKSNPNISDVIQFPDIFFAGASAFYRFLKENPSGYLDEMGRKNIDNLRRIDSLYRYKEINYELKNLLIQQAQTDFDTYLLHPLINNVKVPPAYSNQVSDAIQRLSIEPTIVKHFTLNQSLNLFNMYCRSKIITSGLPVQLQTLVDQSLKSNWSKPIVVSYVIRCLEMERKKDGAAFRAAYERLVKFTVKDSFPQMLQLQKKYFPALGNNNKILLLKNDGSVTTLAAQMRMSKGRLIVIDFWASWCVPCRQAFPDLLKMKERFSGRKVTFIGISLDAEYKTDAWITALKQEKLLGNPNQFKLQNPKTSPLFDRLSIPSIPRYMVLNSKGEILNSDFYDPCNKEFALTLSNYLLKKSL